MLEDYPDITSGFIDVTYDATANILSANGFALTLDDDGVGDLENIYAFGSDIDPGTFLITAEIDDFGTLIGGTLTVEGTVPDLGFNSGTLLTGDLTDFGYPDAGGNPLEFLFDVTGGDVAGLYAGTSGGVILGATGFGGSFAADFDNLMFGMPGTGAGFGDTGVPEPSTLSLLMLGLIATRLRRRRSARQIER